MHPRLDRQIAFLLEIDKLKSVVRRTMLTDRSRCETSAEHSWHLAVMAQVLAEYAQGPVDLGRVLRMTLAHDLVEIDAGDTYVYDAEGNLDKRERELRAAERIFALLPAEQGGELRALWDEFEACSTPDAQFSNALDCLQPILNNWRTQGSTWRGYGVRRQQVLRRMRPVQLYLPAIWPFVLSIIDDATAAGWLLGE